MDNQEISIQYYFESRRGGGVVVLEHPKADAVPRHCWDPRQLVIPYQLLQVEHQRFECRRLA